MKLRAISSILFLTASIGVAGETSSPFNFYWPAESALLVSGIAGGLIGKQRLGSMDPVGPADLNRGDLDDLDRFAAGGYSPSADLASDILVYGIGASMLTVDAWKATRSGEKWRSFFEDFLMLGEAYSWSAALNLNVRAFRIHPRPLTYDGSGAPASEKSNPEAAGSFYSGHASGAFLAATYLATVYPLRHPEFQHRGWLWGGAMASAATVAGLRIVAGRHFPSDVLVGAVVGSLLGWGVPRLHWHSSKGSISGSAGLFPIPGGLGIQAAMAAPGQRPSGARKVLSAASMSRGREK